jgi:hypothetical protein
MGKEKNKGGRPTKYEGEETCRMARVACEQFGSTDEELAKLFDVDASTITEWKRVHPEFSTSVKEGKQHYDTDRIERSLRERALGYSHEAVKIFCTKEGEIVEAPYIERYPPDPTSMIFWLKNRRPKEWRDKQELEHSGKDGQPLTPVINVTVKPKD